MSQTASDFERLLPNYLFTFHLPFILPLIPGAYFCLNMFLITMSTFLAVVVINLYFRQDKKNKVPKWLKRVSKKSVTLTSLYD